MSNRGEKVFEIGVEYVVSATYQVVAMSRQEAISIVTDLGLAREIDVPKIIFMLVVKINQVK